MGYPAAAVGVGSSDPLGALCEPVFMKRAWEQEAQNWVKWARTPGHDAYWYYAPKFLEHIIPPPVGLMLEVGCGEGRVSRDLHARGHQVVGVDASHTLLQHAVEADPASTYVLADGEALPFRAETFDLVVAYNSLMDVDDMPRTVGEATRVLTPPGTFCVCITHPINDAGRFESQQEEARFTIHDSYVR